MDRDSRGFTLVELLVVLAIIALLSSVVFAVLREARQKARDAGRIATARQIGLALTQYEQSQGTYRIASAGYQNSGTGYVGKVDGGDYGTSIASVLKARGYFAANKLTDPIFGSDNYYLGLCATTSEFTLYTKLEQISLQTPTTTIAAACDGSNALALGFNSVSAYSGGEGSTGGNVAVESGGGGGGNIGLIETTLQSGNNFTDIIYANYQLWAINANGDFLRVNPSNTFDEEWFDGSGGATDYTTIAFDGQRVMTASLWDGARFLDTSDTGAGFTQNMSGVGTAVAFDGTHLWSFYGGFFVHPFDLTGWYGTTIDYSSYYISDPPVEAEYAAGYIWLINQANDSIAKFSPGATEATFVDWYALPVGSSPRSLAYDGTYLWIANPGNSTVTKMGTDGTIVGNYAVGAGPRSIAYDGEYMWTANSVGNSVSRIASDGTSTTYGPVAAIGGNPYDIVYDPDNGVMWVMNYSSPAILAKITVR